MKSHLELYKLVKSLSYTEKSYFKKYAQRHTIGKKNIYLILFDEINKVNASDEYNEKIIKSKMSRYTNIKNFSVLKSYLYDMILKSMRLYNSENEIDSVIQNHLEDCRFLFRKGLVAACYNSLNKAKKISAWYDKHDRMYDALKKERMIIKKNDPANTDMLSRVNEQLIKTAEKLKNVSEYIYLNDISVSLINKYGVTDVNELKMQFEKILQHSFLQNLSIAETFYSKIYYYQIWSNYYFSQNLYGEALKIYKKMAELFECNPYMLKENSRNYILILQNCIDMSDMLGLNNEYERFYEKFTGIMRDKSIKLTENQQLYVLSRSYIYRLRKFTNTGNFSEHIPEIRTLLDDITANTERFPAEERIILTYQLAVYYFGCKNYNESLKWLNRIINKDEELRIDLRLECRLLFLILHYEIGNYDLLEYAVKSIYRYLKKRKTLIGIEELILAFIKKIGNVSDKNAVKELFNVMKQGMLPYREALKSYGFNYLAWVESKLQDIEFAQAVKNYNNNN